MELDDDEEGFSVAPDAQTSNVGDDNDSDDAEAGVEAEGEATSTVAAPITRGRLAEDDDDDDDDDEKPKAGEATAATVVAGEKDQVRRDSRQRDRERKDKRRQSKQASAPVLDSRPKAVQYTCNYCAKDISACVRIKCAVCVDVDLCLECFSVGAEITPHKNTHNYHVMDLLKFPIISEDWGADEELLLLEGIEMYGFGNWADIADHLGTRTREECEHHYLTAYLGSPCAPLPDLTVHLDSSRAVLRRPVDRSEEPLNIKPPGPSAIVVSQELAGWMSSRQEFETEYLQEAEQYVADMVFNEDDTDTMKELKTRVAQVYFNKLSERYEKRQYILEHSLLDIKKIQSADRKRERTDRELLQKHRAFQQLTTPQEFDEFLNGLLEEAQIRRRIEQLKSARVLGATTLADVEQLESSGEARMGMPLTGPGSKKHREIEQLVSRKRDRPMLLAPMMMGGRSGSGVVTVAAALSSAPGYELLSKRERELCALVRLYPQQYMLVKDTIVHADLREGGTLQTEAARQLLASLESDRVTRLLDFFEESGWINARGGGSGSKRDAARAAAASAPSSSLAPVDLAALSAAHAKAVLAAGAVNMHMLAPPRPFEPMVG